MKEVNGPIVAPIGKPVVDGPIDASINESKFLSIVDNKLTVQYDNPFDPEAVPMN